MTNNQTIYGTVSGILKRLSEQSELGATKAILAELRNSIGRKEFPILALSNIFRQLPEKYLGRTGSFTKGEKSVVMAMQLYAIHQQGLEDNVTLFEEPRESTNLGRSLSKYRLQIQSDQGDSVAFDRRFNAMITASTIEELFQHLRHLIKIARKDIQINYAKLAQDLYTFQYRPADIKLKWSRQYYRFNNKEIENKGEENNGK